MNLSAKTICLYDSIDHEKDDPEERSHMETIREDGFNERRFLFFLLKFINLYIPQGKWATCKLSLELFKTKFLEGTF